MFDFFGELKKLKKLEKLKTNVLVDPFASLLLSILSFRRLDVLTSRCLDVSSALPTSLDVSPSLPAPYTLPAGSLPLPAPQGEGRGKV